MPSEDDADDQPGLEHVADALGARTGPKFDPPRTPAEWALELADSWYQRAFRAPAKLTSSGGVDGAELERAASELGELAGIFADPEIEVTTDQIEYSCPYCSERSVGLLAFNEHVGAAHSDPPKYFSDVIEAADRRVHDPEEADPV